MKDKLDGKFYEFFYSLDVLQKQTLLELWTNEYFKEREELITKTIMV